MNAITLTLLYSDAEDPLVPHTAPAAQLVPRSISLANTGISEWISIEALHIAT
jgi:hypothetical protein